MAWFTFAATVALSQIGSTLGAPPYSMQEPPIAGAGATGKLFGGDKIREFPLSSKRFSKFLRPTLAGEGTAHGSLVRPAAKSPRWLRRSQKSAWLQNCSKWAVVTTINGPTEAVQNAAALQGWCLVVVGDAKGPKIYPLADGNPSVVFLNADRQRRMADRSEFVRGTPWNHFGRKNIGFLYAIQRGATMIFDFDDDNILLGMDGKSVAPELRLDPEELTGTGGDSNTTWSTPPTGFDTYNPYPALGAGKQGKLPPWPRGLPLEHYKDPMSARGATPADSFGRAAGTSRLGTGPARVGVFQFAADVDPDVDAIYRLTRTLPFSFSPSAPSLVIPSGVLTPYNAQASVHTYDALWAMLLPITVPGRVSDIWRGYAAQRLFWDTSLRLVYTPPRVKQLRNAHNYLADFQSESDLYHKAGALVRMLNQWECKSTSPSVPECMEQLWIELYERDYFGVADVEQVQRWLKALVRLGYKFPEYYKAVHKVAIF